MAKKRLTAGSMTESIRARLIEISENGVDGLSLHGVVKASGVSIGAIYNLKNKTDSDCSLTIAEKLVPIIFKGSTLNIVRN